MLKKVVTSACVLSCQLHTDGLCARKPALRTPKHLRNFSSVIMHSLSPLHICPDTLGQIGVMLQFRKYTKLCVYWRTKNASLKNDKNRNWIILILYPRLGFRSLMRLSEVERMSSVISGKADKGSMEEVLFKVMAKT